jgi:hypothetical protein
LIYYKLNKYELSGRFVGFSENVGHQMTFEILTEDNLKVIHQLRIKLAELDPNLRLDELTGADTLLDPDIQPTKYHPGGNHVDDITPDEDFIQGRPGEHTSMAIVDADDIIGRAYLQEPEEDGTQHRLSIIPKLDEHNNANIANDPTMIQFRATNDQETYEEIMMYGQILDELDHEDGAENEWYFKCMNDHQDPLQQSDADYKGSWWNVQICWENGEMTREPLGITGKSNAVTCAIYGKEHNLLEQDRLKRFVRLAR